MTMHLVEKIDELKRQKTLIIGDMVADVYLEGKIARISREAPVLVLEHQGETLVPGGAANAVHNAAVMEGRVFAVGILGEDEAGARLSSVLAAKGVIVEGLLCDPERSTTTKTRIMAGGLATVRQQVVRVDRESKSPLSAAAENAILAYLRKHLYTMNAVVMSDYGSGTITPKIREFIIHTCKEAAIPTIVDSRYDILSFRGVTIVKQNEAETAQALEWTEIPKEMLETAGRLMLEKMHAQMVLITRGADGMSLFEANGRISHIPVTNVSEVYDVSGAGDTAVAAMALAIGAGIDPPDAARIANFAAGVVVRKLGTATASLDEIKKAIEIYEQTAK